MSTYKVIKFFTDLQDDKHPYNVGDIFPRDGATVDEARLAELSSNKNRQGRPLIKKVKEDLPEIIDANVSSESAESTEPIAETTTKTTEDKPKSKKKGRKKNVNAE